MLWYEHANTDCTYLKELLIVLSVRSSCFGYSIECVNLLAITLLLVYWVDDNSNAWSSSKVVFVRSSYSQVDALVWAKFVWTFGAEPGCLRFHVLLNTAHRQVCETINRLHLLEGTLDSTAVCSKFMLRLLNWVRQFIGDHSFIGVLSWENSNAWGSSKVVFVRSAHSQVDALVRAD